MTCSAEAFVLYYFIGAAMFALILAPVAAAWWLR